ncbi:MAG: DUF4428 domain-containing protein [Erysipelotrichaceae bacterium]|nr:DUF4428 domain-containing protein [Erysipelotrichaceae bacterium]
MDNERLCSLCGEPLSRYGNKKIKDGVLCRNCIKPASPWLSDSDYEKMSVEDFRKHLEYRNENLKKLDVFKTDKKVEGKYTLYLDEADKRFLISKRKDYKKDNADVFDFDEIKEISIYEEKYGETDDVDICFDIKLENKQIDNVFFRVNEFPGLIRDSKEHKESIDLALSYLAAFEEEEDLHFEQVEGEE